MAAGCHETSRRAGFQAIQRHYKSFYKRLEKQGQFPYRVTSRGVWATSTAPAVYELFRFIRLEKHRLLIDLGSGDGIVVCIASLFTTAIGIEIDWFLCKLAAATSRILGLDAQVGFICGDFLKLPIWKADCLYLYPDKPFHELEVLLRRWSGRLLVCGNHIPPTRMIAESYFHSGRDKFVVYINPR